MLHIIKSEAGYQQAKPYFQQGDDVLFVESGCYIANAIDADQVWRSYVLKEDMDARGLVNTREEGAQITDFNGFVELTEQHIASTTWE